MSLFQELKENNNKSKSNIIASGRPVKLGTRGYPIRNFRVPDPEIPIIQYPIPDPNLISDTQIPDSGIQSGKIGYPIPILNLNLKFLTKITTNF